ncbi:alpha/beta fold hydrolase [Streptomyces omiyaensis]|uniref:alpha/beta fold hydrolase n=1 Tax=Streptomyces omiyaensis TaxID=68247 RepID=UPI001679BB05|nr:alpha/beta hydrolase [Streptomyces omiyaensis]
MLDKLPPQPTLYLHGTEDPVVDEATLAEIVAMPPPGSDGAMIEGAGHFLLTGKPEEVNRRILAFLAR